MNVVVVNVVLLMFK